MLLVEDFETGTIDTLKERWENVRNPEGEVLAFVADAPPGSTGRRCLQMTSTLGRNTGGHLYRRLPKAVETVFARFYVKFPTNAQYVHHFVTLGGYYPPTPWPQGGAGIRPRGDERFTVGIEPFGEHGRFAPPGIWKFYTYWPEMKISADGKYWGNGLGPATPARIPVDRWQCVEVMLRCNTPAPARNGELALWLDGQLVLHLRPGSRISRWTGMGFQEVSSGGEPFPGFRWRTDERLKVNFFWLLFYVTENAARQNRVSHPEPINRVMFDHIVVATRYIGPIAR